MKTHSLPRELTAPIKPRPVTRAEALRYHAKPRPGKIEVIPTKPYYNKHDLALAYSPGVAYACQAIEQNPHDVYRYTNKGNLVAVISNGTAVLGLGNIGPEAGKPVMEGKALLFKIFADIDAFDIELNAPDPQTFIQTVQALAPTFGAINLEDIKAPEAFQIEDTLRKTLTIPLMHDDQHGTAIITSAGLLNALHLQQKEISQIKLVVNGAGAAAIACTNMFQALGVRKENITMCDSHGVIRTNRPGLTPQKAAYATSRSIETLQQAIQGADVFLGLSVANVLTPQMLLSMAPRPIVFALANPDPEIDYQTAIKTRPDIIMATGRSDLPNQINNVLGFPYIFRAALDTRATTINEPMKLAAAKAIALLARQPVPEKVTKLAQSGPLTFGPDYIVPSPFDPRLLPQVASAVAQAAMQSGVAQTPISDLQAYARSLSRRLNHDTQAIRHLIGIQTPSAAHPAS